ncbi:unnamed protein product, partial [Musa acuminata var. zebrina]
MLTYPEVLLKNRTKPPHRAEELPTYKSRHGWGLVVKKRRGVGSSWLLSLGRGWKGG